MAIGSILTMNIILTMNEIPIFPRFCHWDADCIVIIRPRATFLAYRVLFILSSGATQLNSGINVTM